MTRDTLFTYGAGLLGVGLALCIGLFSQKRGVTGNAIIDVSFDAFSLSSPLVIASIVFFAIVISLILFLLLRKPQPMLLPKDFSYRPKKHIDEDDALLEVKKVDNK